MKELYLLIISFWVGGAGYLIVTFWMAPILRYLEIRHQVTSALIYYANVFDPEFLNDEMQQRYLDGMSTHRKHAAELTASYYRLPRWFRLKLKFMKENPLEASKNLIGLSNCSKSDQANLHVQALMRNLRISKTLDI